MHSKAETRRSPRLLRRQMALACGLSALCAAPTLMAEPAYPVPDADFLEYLAAFGDDQGDVFDPQDLASVGDGSSDGSDNDKAGSVSSPPSAHDKGGDRS